MYTGVPSQNQIVPTGIGYKYTSGQYLRYIQKNKGLFVVS